jgi:hypothetical protein
MGEAFFSKTSGVGDWDLYPELVVPWLGSYNWRYEVNSEQVEIAQKGNVQGMLTVAEPGTIMLLGFGLIGLAGFATRRKK